MNDNSQEPRRLDPSAVTDAVHHMSGEEGKAKIRLSALVSAIFKKHTEEEKEQVLTAGLAGHVPDERSMVPQWPRPWLYSRVFLWIFALAWFTYGLLYLTYNLYVTATLLLLAVSMFPLTMLFFFYECFFICRTYRTIIVCSYRVLINTCCNSYVLQHSCNISTCSFCKRIDSVR